ncbi:unnamed protein product [Brassica oleracea]
MIDERSGKWRERDPRSDSGEVELAANVIINNRGNREPSGDCIIITEKEKKNKKINKKKKRRNEKPLIAPSSLPNDVIEEIFLRLPVKVLIRLRSLSKQWRVTVESLSFAERHLKIAKESHVKVMVIGEEDYLKGSLEYIPHPDTNVGFRTFCLESGSCPNEGVTKCEVFDFKANTWRYLTCTPSYRIFPTQKPAYANGSVYWLTELHEGRIEVVDFDIQTETFRLLRKIIPAIASSDPSHIDMCTLDNHLYPGYLEVETIRRHLGEDFFNIDLLSCPSHRTEIRDQFKWSQKDLVEPSTPVAVCKNKKIMLSHCYSRGLVQYDPLTKSLDFFYRNFMARRKVTYFQSLISHI